MLSSRTSGTLGKLWGVTRNLRRKMSIYVPDFAVVDEIVNVRIDELAPKSRVNVFTEMMSSRGDKYYSTCKFQADANGVVDFSRDAPLSPDSFYTGVDPMGFIWSMKPSPDMPIGSRFSHAKVDRTIPVRMHVFEEENNNKLIASKSFERGYMTPKMKRIPIREGRVRGTLFLPEGDGPWNGVIDMFGGAGGLIEFRGALMASKGFAVLSLAYFRYEDLTTNFRDLDLGYFREAVSYLQNRSEVVPGGIGIVGVSKGGELALQMATFFSDEEPSPIAACACINSVCFSPDMVSYGGNPTHRPLPMDYLLGDLEDGQRLHLKNEWELFLKHPERDKYCLPVENIKCPLLYLTSLADNNVLSYDFAECVMDRLKRKGFKYDAYHYSFEGAGHLLEPPYAPLCAISRMPFAAKSVLFDWGGETVQHNKAQVAAWPKLVNFLRQSFAKRNRSKL